MYKICQWRNYLRDYMDCFINYHELGTIICSKNIFVLWCKPFLLNTPTTPSYSKVITQIKRKEFDYSKTIDARIIDNLGPGIQTYYIRLVVPISIQT